MTINDPWQTFSFDLLQTLVLRPTIAAVIALLRQYLLTLTVLCAGFSWSAPLSLIIISALVAGIVDFLLVGRSAELHLYRAGLDFDAPAPRQVSGSEAIRLHLLAIFVSSILVLAPYALRAEAEVQQPFGMAALIFAGATASYCGLLMSPPPSTPRDLLTNVDLIPYQLFVLDLLPTPARRVLWVFVRILLGLAAMLPFVAIVGLIHSEPFRAPMLLVVPALAAFFQLGFVTWLAGLFLARWWRSPVREMELPKG